MQGRAPSTGSGVGIRLARNRAVLPTLLLLGLGAGSAQAQIPDAGQALQQMQRPLPAPALAPPSFLPKPQPADSPDPVESGGPRVTLKSLQIRGNTRFDAGTLERAAGFQEGLSLDFGGLERVARSIASFYHQQGYPFASAALPAQDLKDGVLQVEVIEGRYGKIESSGDFPADEGAPFLSALKAGEVIRSDVLERTVLIIDDLPMISVSPRVRPGAAYGTGDLNIEITQDALWGGEVGVDTLGNRFTGQYRTRASLSGFSKFLFGDAIRLTTLVTNENLKLGSIEYEAPLNGDGLRAHASIARTTYQLAEEYTYLGASGIADVFSVRSSYPLVRSQRQNLSVSVGYTTKYLRDRYDFVGSNNRKRSYSIPVAVYFDSRDGALGGGLTYGNIAVTAMGRLDLDDGLLASDAITARSAGKFSKVNIELARIQTLQGHLSLFGRVLFQATDNNLDSSEKFNLGGIYGVRAYPVGEGLGDRGWLGQVELRYKFENITGFVFTDGGESRVNAHPWDAVLTNAVRARGNGLGVRHHQEPGWNWETVLSWRSTDAPVTDRQGRNPRFWGFLTYKF